MGVRELLWLVVGLLLAYVAYQLYRAWRPVRVAAAPQALAAGEGGTARSDAFQVELELQQLHRELAQLREECADQRRELTDLAARVTSQKEQLEAAATGQGVSPEYNEALVFARRGLDVEAIAERCGITVAEAELVRSLARRSEPEAGA